MIGTCLVMWDSTLWNMFLDERIALDWKVFDDRYMFGDVQFYPTFHLSSSGISPFHSGM
jgi:hypothetical protein